MPLEKIDGVMYMDGFDDCVLGHGERCGQPTLAIYSQFRLVRKLMEDDMTEEEALEHMQYNQLGAWVGDKTPIFMDDLE